MKTFLDIPMICIIALLSYGLLKDYRVTLLKLFVQMDSIIFYKFLTIQF